MGAPVDLVKLDGTWRLQYTSAPDVLVLLEAAARLPFFQVSESDINSPTHFLLLALQSPFSDFCLCNLVISISPL